LNLRRLEDEIERLRTSDCTVLVLGETGTGKSVLARRIHEASPRRGGPFIDVNCAGLSREFFESELFGHERGAFTGAHAPKQGLFDAADGGTLFLDEIGDIDLQVQPKILKVLEEKRFRRMGGLRERDVDVRLVAATHHDLLGAVEQRTFRADLFYRISTVTIRVPSLRERPEDLPVLVQTLIAGTGRSEVTLSPAAWEKMHASSWPGNIRELKNVIHRARRRGRRRPAHPRRGRAAAHHGRPRGGGGSRGRRRAAPRDPAEHPLPEDQESWPAPHRPGPSRRAAVGTRTVNVVGVPRVELTSIEAPFSLTMC